MMLGNYLDATPISTVIEQKPSDMGTGTVELRTYQFTYEEGDDDEEPEFRLETGYVFVDLRTGIAQEPEFEDVLKWFDTYEEAYRYTIWLVVNARNKHYEF